MLQTKPTIKPVTKSNAFDFATAYILAVQITKANRLSRELLTRLSKADNKVT
jgi:hypothetical protein